MNEASCPTLLPKTRLRYNRQRDACVLLWPERGLLLNRSAGDILNLCRGHHTLSSIVNALSDQYRHTKRNLIQADVHRLILDLHSRGLLTLE